MTKLEKEILYQEYDQLLEFAHEAGLKAGNACKPTLYKWSAETVPLGEEYDWENKGYEVHGNCGCAGVMTREHGAGTFVKYLKAKHTKDGYCYVQKDGYRKAWNVPDNCPDYGQQVEPKMAYAEAFAEVLNEFGIKAFAWEYLT
tara:strand:- start:58 stop:489 length:432 start_codon:yes stop_codon:yes gene_type:complete